MPTSTLLPTHLKVQFQMMQSVLLDQIAIVQLPYEKESASWSSPIFRRIRSSQSGELIRFTLDYHHLHQLFS